MSLYLFMLKYRKFQPRLYNLGLRIVMSVVFEALVKNSSDDGWFIELKDTVDDRVVICKDLKEFETKIQELSEDYGGKVDEVKWISHESLTPPNEQKLRVAMMEYHEKYKDQISDEKES